MKKYLLRGLGVAGVIYALMSYFYSGAEYADFGVSLISTSLLSWLAPLVGGVVLPAVATRFPKVAAVVKTLWSMWQNRKASAPPEPYRPTLRDKLYDLMDLELDCLGDAASEAAVATLRKRTIERYRSA